MDKNYYDILEINKNASSEIIEKAYKTLVKKYHPDLQENNLKTEYEERLKQINEAYEVLSNEETRKQYDFELSKKEVETSQLADELLNENINLKNELNHLKQNSSYVQQSYDNDDIPKNQNFNMDKNLNYENQLRYQQEIQQAREKAYYDAYIQDLKNRGYKIKYKKTLKDYFKNFISLLCTLLVVFILWQIPFIRNIFVDMYHENKLVQYFVDIFINLFK